MGVLAALRPRRVHAELFGPLHCPFRRTANVVIVADPVIAENGAPLDGAPAATVDPIAEPEEAPHWLGLAPAPVRVVEARRVGQKEVKWPDGRIVLDGLVDRPGGRIVGHAKAHRIGVGDTFQVAVFFLTENTVLDAAGFDGLDKIARWRQELRERLAGDLPPMLKLHEFCPVAGEFAQFHHSVHRCEVGDRETGQIALAERSVRLPDAAVAGIEQIAAGADEEEIGFGIPGPFDKVAGPGHLRKIVGNCLGIAIAQQDFSL